MRRTRCRHEPERLPGFAGIRKLVNISAASVLNELPAGKQLQNPDPFVPAFETQGYVIRIMGYGPERTGLVNLYKNDFRY
jgi:hypothetical protein